MGSNNAKKLSPIVTDDQKLEVSLENGNAVIRLFTWSDSLGWCGQKTLPVGTEMLDELHRAITAARFAVNRKATHSTSDESKILEFPQFN